MTLILAPLLTYPLWLVPIGLGLLVGGRAVGQRVGSVRLLLPCVPSRHGLLTIVAFGASAPELAVSVGAVRAGSGDLALGNILGSNIFNVLFILGLSAIAAPLPVSQRVIWIEVPLVIATTALALDLAAAGHVSGPQLDGLFHRRPECLPPGTSGNS